MLITKSDTGEAVHSGTTPLTVSLTPHRRYFRGQGYQVKFELPGHKPAQVFIRPELSGWYFGNIIFGGLLGMVVVDPLTGAMWNLTPEKIEQPLTAEQASVIKEQNGFVVVLTNQLTPRERASLVRIN